MEQENAIWKRYTYQQLLDFTDKTFDDMWSKYTRELPEHEKARLIEIVKLERLHKKLETLVGRFGCLNMNKN